MVYHANHFYDRAEPAYRIAARLAPDDYRWIYCQALLQEENGNEKAQLKLLQKTVQLSPRCRPALVKLGDIHLKRDQVEEAARYFDRGVDAAGRESAPQALFGLARIAARREDWRRVRKLLETILQQCPRVRPAHQLLAEAYEALGQSEKANEERAILRESDLTALPPVNDPVAEEILTLSCSSTRLLKEAGLRTRFGAQDQALQLARRAVEAEPTDPDARHFVSRTLLEKYGTDPGAVDEALIQLNEALRLRPDDLVPLFYAAAFFFKENKTDDAAEQLRAILARYAGNPEAEYYLGLVADRQDRIAQAVTHYRNALNARPDYAEPYHRLGLILAADGKLDQAISYLQKAVQLKPMFTGARCHLGLALEQAGRVSEAVKEYSEALRLKPHDPQATAQLQRLGRAQ
jgi:tetratricopeptide (TPR) repeat protein